MSEQKTAKVVDTLSCRPWDNPKGGTIYFHKIELDNGDIGEVGKKKENAFQKGDSFTYTSESSQYGLKFKEVFQGGNGFGGGGFKGGGRGSSASFALSYAKDLVCAAEGKLSTVKDMTEATLMVAGRFHKWLKENE